MSYILLMTIKSWAMVNLQLSAGEAESLSGIRVPQGYASLSLNAINKILPYLRRGYRYDEAVILANLPTVLKTKQDDAWFKEVEENVSVIMEDHSLNPIDKNCSIHQCVTDYLRNNNVGYKQLDKLYHPSMIETYQSVLPVGGEYKLGSPRTSAVRNPMAMRALFRLRKLLNELLTDHKIDKDTIIRIEFSRNLNDANMRKAIEVYQREQNKHRVDYAEMIRSYKGTDYEPSETEILKYQLWEEQGHRCPYTNKEIGLADFLSSNPKFDIEHTIPRSRGGDNSQMNKTLCDSRYNREVKKAQIPSELCNHEEILTIVDSFGWQEKIDSLRKQIERTKGYSATKEEKDRKLQQRHRLKMQLDYWEGKLKRFTMKEIPDGFSNRQGVDVGIIGRYARLYLMTVFNRVHTVKGATTAEFRKMWGLQDYYSAKERSNHSHHCIDAITIACIGKNEYDQWARFAKDEESYRLSKGTRPTLPKPWATFTEDVKAVSESILVPHYTPSNLAKHTKKKLRIRGKIQYGVDGAALYVQGDTARCVLHEQTFYGAIKKDDEIKYVVRKSLDGLKPEDVEKIVDDVVKAKVRAAIAEKGFKKAMSETIWMNEELQIPIKKVRIYVPSVTNPIKLKKHRDKSVHEHKRFLHVKNDGNYCMAIYEGTSDRGKTVRSFRIVNNLDAVNYYNGKIGSCSLVPQYDDKDLPLKCVLKIGTMVLFYEKSPKELYECSAENLSKRLYKVTGMSTLKIKQGDKHYDYGTLELRYHLEARRSSDLKVKSGEWKEGEDIRPIIKIIHSQFNAYVEGYDFTIASSGKIIFKR